MMNKILFISAMAVLIMSVHAVQAVSIYREPNEIILNILLTRENLSVYQTAQVNLTNNEMDIIDNISFHSPYIKEFIPVGKNLEPDIPMIFDLIIGVDYSDRETSESTENETIMTEINISGEINGEPVNLTPIPLTLNVNMSFEPIREYIYRKCFVEDGQEYCAIMNTTELQNVTIVNETTVNFTVLMPFETVRDFLQTYENRLHDTVYEMQKIANSVNNQTNKTMELQKKENRRFQNAFILENYLKNYKNPLWFEIEPINTIINTTGMDKQQFAEAISVLYENGKIVHEFRDEWITTPFQGGGVMTRMVKKTYIASTERLAEEQRTGTSYTLMMIAIITVITSIIFMALYQFRWRKKPGW